MTVNARLNDEELEAIRKRSEATSAKFWMVKYGLGEGAEVNTGHGFGSKNVCVTQYTADAEFIAHAREDVPKLLAEIERLKSDIRTKNFTIKLYKKVMYDEAD
jgi:hypothetical protein